jgi:anti-sigma factor RsiW
MNCQDIKEELVAYLDDELDPDTRAEIEAHLESCAACRAEREAYTATLQAVGKLAAPGLTPDFKRRFFRDFDDAQRRPPWILRPLTLAGAGLAAGALVLVLLLVPGQPARQAKVDAVIASHLELFEDYEAISNLDVLEDFEFIQAMDDEV